MACFIAALVPAGPSLALDLPGLLSTLESLRARHAVAGFGLAVVKQGQPVYVGGGGTADRQSGRAVDGDTLWRIGSVTKVFTGIATLIALRNVDEGLDTPLRTIVPEAPFVNPWETSDPLRVGHLLEHTAGLSDLSRIEFDSTDPKPLSLDEAFRLDPSSRVLRWPPGRYASYSNVGAGLAALAIERLSGEEYESFVASRILRPLGMSSAGFRLEGSTEARLAQGYDSDGVKPLPYWHVLYRAFGGLNADGRDMARFLQWLLDPSRAPVLSPEEMSQLETPRTTLAARSGLRYGYAKGLYQYVHDGFVWMGHGGDADGYLSRLGYRREAGTGYFLVINAFKPQALREMQDAVETALERGFSRPEPPPVMAVASSELESMAGCYRTVTRRFTWQDGGDEESLTVRVQGDHLVTIPATGPERDLWPVTPQHFRRADETVATSAIVRDLDGHLILQGDMGNLRRESGLPDAGGCVP